MVPAAEHQYPRPAEPELRISARVIFWGLVMPDHRAGRAGCEAEIERD